MTTHSRALTITGLVAVSVPAVGSALVSLITAARMMAYIEDMSLRYLFGSGVWSIIVAVVLLRLWRSVLSDDEGLSGRGDAAWSVAIGVLTAPGPFTGILTHGMVFGTLAAGLLAPAGMWLGSLGRQRGARALGMAGIVLCAVGLFWTVFFVAAAWSIPFPPPS